MNHTDWFEITEDGIIIHYEINSEYLENCNKLLFESLK